MIDSLKIADILNEDPQAETQCPSGYYHDELGLLQPLCKGKICSLLSSNAKNDEKPEELNTAASNIASLPDVRGVQTHCLGTWGEQQRTTTATKKAITQQHNSPSLHHTEAARQPPFAAADVRNEQSLVSVDGKGTNGGLDCKVYAEDTR